MTSSDALPDSICPICQDKFENVAFLDRCGHKFCYQCVQRWSEIKAECPLCKRPFHHIAHRMGSDFRWKVYTVRPPGADSFDNINVRRFRNQRRITAQRRTSQRDPTTRRTASPQDRNLLRTSTAGNDEPPREEETPGPSSRSDQMRATHAEPNTSTAGAEQPSWEDATPGPSNSRSDQMGATQSTGLDSTESSRDGSANHEANVSQSGRKRKCKRGGKAKTSGNGCFKNSGRNGDDDSDDDDYNLTKRRKS